MCCFPRLLRKQTSSINFMNAKWCKMSQPKARLPPWARLIGTPKYDDAGIPLYARGETIADSAVHALGLAWCALSSTVLLFESTAWRYALFCAVSSLMYTTSALYNLVGCGLRLHSERLRNLDQATIFLYLGGTYTLFLTGKWVAMVWGLCGAGALMKLAFGRGADVPAMAGYIALGVTGLALLPRASPAFEGVAAAFALVGLGALAGYLNNAMWGAMAFWHACGLGANILLWNEAYRAAAAGRAVV